MTSGLFYTILFSALVALLLVIEVFGNNKSFLDAVLVIALVAIGGGLSIKGILWLENKIVKK